MPKSAKTGQEELSAQQERALMALLACPTVEAAAEQSGASVRSLYRWLNEEEAFQARYRALRRTVVERSVARLQKATTKAVETLERNLNCAQPSVSNRAAQIILEQAFRGVELLDHEERLKAVEAAQEGKRT